MNQVLDLGVLGDEPLEPEPLPPPRAGVSRRGLLLGTGGAVVVGALALRSRAGQAATTDGTPTVTTGRLSTRLAGSPSQWQLFAVADDAVVRLQPASGRFTRTPIPPLGEGQVSVVAARGRLLLRPVAAAAGWAVPDAGPATPLPADLAGIGPVLPGPDLGQVWTQPVPETLRLVDVDRPGASRVVAPIPQFATTGPMADGAGGLLFEGVGGIYRVGIDGLLAVRTGIVLAVGAGGLLTLETDSRGRWRTLVRARDGAVRVAPVAIGPQVPHGVLSPDGRSVVLYVVDSSMHLALVDLDSGAQRELDVDVTGVAGDGTVVWSPDGRWLFCVDADSGVRVVDARTATTSVALDLPAVRQLALRTA